MPALRHNILANYAGQVWIAVVSVIFIPLYMHALGMEGFGLVGFMLSMQALAVLFDLGLGGVLNRELARLGPGAAAGDLVRTLEWPVWLLAVLVAAGLWLASGPVATHWLKIGQLGSAAASRAVAIIGLTVSLQLLVSFYGNGLAGLERLTLLNLVNTGFVTLRNVGVLPLLWISATIDAFLWWQVLCLAMHAVVLAAVLRWQLAAGPVQFRPGELRRVGRFAGGLVAIMALATALTQLDRLVLSGARPLVELGYYTLAVSVATGLGRMVQPMFGALYPRYSRLVAAGETEALVRLYHQSNQGLAVIVAGLSMVLALFARDVLFFWTGDAAAAERSALPLALLVAGTALNGMMNLPYALQLAHGWTRLTVLTNLMALGLGIPFCIWAVNNHGLAGAASLWLLINLGSVFVNVPLMHRRLLRDEMGAWYLRDVLPPFLAAAAVGVAARLLLPALERDIAGLFVLGGVTVATLGAAALASPFPRALAWQALRHGPRLWKNKN